MKEWQATSVFETQVSSRLVFRVILTTTQNIWIAFGPIRKRYSSCPVTKGGVLTSHSFGMHFGLVKVSDLILLNESGKPVGGATHLPANAAGFQIHSHLHKRYPHVNAACHTHSKYGKAYSAFARRLEMINQDALNFYGDAHGVYPDFGGVVLEDSEGEKLADCLGENGKALILRNHGLLTVGRTVDEAAYLYTLMERSCEVQLLVDAAAESSLKRKLYVSDEAAQFTFNATSDPVCHHFEAGS